jgi:hypothetical protein
MSNTIICPHCHKSIDLGDIAKHELEGEFAKREATMQEELKKREEEIKKEMWGKAVAAAKAQSEEENKKREVELESLRKRDDESRKKEMDFLRERQQFEDTIKNAKFENEKALFEARKLLEEDLKIQLRKEQNLEQEKSQLEWEKKLAERDKQMEILQRSLAEANQKANQGSMQIQGEIQENALKGLLASEFPFDMIDDVPTGIKGADLIHTVRNQFGHSAGIIAWESKNTKAWSDSWVDKLKEDRLRVNASISVIISNVLPEGVNHFGLYRDIWVTEWKYVVPLTIALREQMITMEQVKNSLKGKDEKMDMLYSYLTSTEFRDKIQNVIEAFQSMKESLETEKRSMERIWASREKQLDRVISNTARLYGDMQGLIGAQLPKVEYLELGSGKE